MPPLESQLARATLVIEVEFILFIIKHCQTPLTFLSVTVSGNKIGQDPVRGRGGHTLIIYALITAALAAEELAGAWLGLLSVTSLANGGLQLVTVPSPLLI